MRTPAPNLYTDPASTDTVRPQRCEHAEPFFDLEKDGKRLLLRYRFDEAWRLVVNLEQVDILNPGEEPAVTAHRMIVPEWTAPTPSIEPGMPYDVRAAFQAEALVVLVDGRPVWSTRT